MLRVKTHKMNHEIHDLFHTYFAVSRFKNMVEVQVGRRCFRIFGAKGKN